MGNAFELLELGGLIYTELTLGSTNGFEMWNPEGRGGGEETRSGTEKRCSHNLQSGHPAWWSADNYSIFPTVYILEARIKANRQRSQKCLKN